MKKPKKLTAIENAWLAEAKDLFGRCPKRFDFVTIGDPDLQVIDNTHIRDVDLHDGGAEKAGIVLGMINTKGTVHAVSG